MIITYSRTCKKHKIYKIDLVLVGRLLTGLIIVWPLVGRFGHRLAVLAVVRRFGSVSVGLALFFIGVCDGEQNKLGPEPKQKEVMIRVLRR